jgi:hypothetical protein
VVGLTDFNIMVVALELAIARASKSHLCSISCQGLISGSSHHGRVLSLPGY